jgi:hypothetical protein
VACVVLYSRRWKGRCERRWDRICIQKQVSGWQWGSEAEEKPGKREVAEEKCGSGKVWKKGSSRGEILQKGTVLKEKWQKGSVAEGKFGWR